MPGITLDTGGLIALDRNDRRMAVLLARALETNGPVTVPASALVQVIRGPNRQARLSRLIRQVTTDVVAGRVDAVHVGRLLAASGTADVVDAHVVCATRAANESSPRTPTTSPDSIQPSNSSCSDPSGAPLPPCTAVDRSGRSNGQQRAESHGCGWDDSGGQFAPSLRAVGLGAGEHANDGDPAVGVVDPVDHSICAPPRAVAILEWCSQRLADSMRGVEQRTDDELVRGERHR